MRPSRFLLELPETTYERWNISDAPAVPEDDGDTHYDTDLFDDGPHIDGDGA